MKCKEYARDGCGVEDADCKPNLGGCPERVVRLYLRAGPDQHDVGEHNLWSSRDHFRLGDNPVKTPAWLVD